MQFQVLGLSVAIDLEVAARFDAAEDAHRPIGDPIFGSDAASDVLLADLSRGQVAHGPSPPPQPPTPP